MATSASRSRLFPARSRKSYRLEMESRTLLLLLSLMALTGVVIFYLGLVTGKALRDPNATVAMNATLGQGAGVAPATPGALAFGEALKGDKQAVEGLRAEGTEAAERTEALVSQAVKQLELREVNPTAPAASTAPAAGTAPAASTAPMAAAPRASAPTAPTAPTAPRMAQPASNAPADDSLYTVQVFSSQRQENARELMNKLRNMGFSAYLNRYEAADREVWYRVRVGRTDRSGAEALQSRLKREANLRNPQIQKL